MAHLKSSSVDLVLSSLGLLLLLVDVGLDAAAVVRFYQEGSYVCLAVLLLLLVGSSALAQLYSWLWYNYDQLQMHTEVEERLKNHMRSLHVFQLGVYVRSAQTLWSHCFTSFEPLLLKTNQLLLFNLRACLIVKLLPLTGSELL